MNTKILSVAMNTKIISVGRQEDVEPIDALVTDLYRLTVQSSTEFCNKRNSQLMQVAMMIDPSVFVDKPYYCVKLSDLPEYQTVVQTVLTRDEPSYAIDGRVIFRVDVRTRGAIPRGSTIYVWVNDNINIIGIDAPTFAGCIRQELKKTPVVPTDTVINVTNVDTRGEITDKDMSGYYHS